MQSSNVLARVFVVLAREGVVGLALEKAVWTVQASAVVNQGEAEKGLATLVAI